MEGIELKSKAFGKQLSASCVKAIRGQM